MSKWVYIEDISKYVGQEVTIKGWMYNKRSSSKIHFLQIRDGTGFIQAIMEKEKFEDEVFKRVKKLKIETSMILSGVVREEERAPGGYEIDVTSIDIVHVPKEDYPISKKEHGVDFLMEHRHLWLRSKRQWAIMKVRNEIVKAIRDFFYENRFVLIDSPILTGSIGESAGNLFDIEYFDLGKAYLSQTGQLYLEAAIQSLGKVYCFGPTFRAEKSKTRRHLTEFWMVEAEVAYYGHEDNMRLQEELVAYTVERVLKNAKDYLEMLGRDTGKLTNVKTPFPRISYTEAIEILKRAGKEARWGDDIGGDEETIISQKFDRPVMVYNYPKDIKAFYMQPNPDNDKEVLCDDMLAPEGYGEIIGGSERIWEYDVLYKRIKENDLPVEAYEWYLDLRRWGAVPHSGFGMGIERLVAWITGIRHIREAIPFPRTIYRIYP